MDDNIIISPANLDRADLLALLAFHLREAQDHVCTSAYDAQRLQEKDVYFFEARDESGALMGCAGIKTLSPTHAEVKSVRTHPDHLRKGVSRALMEHVTRFAREQGIIQLSLETHPTAPYAAALGLYAALGYSYCAPFGAYTDTEQSVYMTKMI